MLEKDYLEFQEKIRESVDAYICQKFDRNTGASDLYVDFKNGKVYWTAHWPGETVGLVNERGNFNIDDLFGNIQEVLAKEKLAKEKESGERKILAELKAKYPEPNLSLVRSMVPSRNGWPAAIPEPLTLSC